MGGYNLGIRKRRVDARQRIAGTTLPPLHLFKDLWQASMNAGQWFVELSDPARQAPVDKTEGADPLLLFGGHEHLKQ